VVEFSKRKNYVISPFIDVNWRQITELVKQFTRFDQILSKIIIYEFLLLFIILFMISRQTCALKILKHLGLSIEYILNTQTQTQIL